MLKGLIVDDDENSMNIIRHAVELFTDVNIVGTAGSGMEAIEFIKGKEVDLVMLDIEMDDMSGFDVASYIYRNYPKIQYVFITGHSDFAVEGYEYQPLSFLVKPISISRLERILELAKERCEPPARQVHKQVGLHVDSRLEIVDIEEVAYFETAGRKARVHCRDGRTLDTTETLKKLYEVFEEYDFYRCHQSFVIQIGLIESISSDMFHRSYLIKLKGVDCQIPLSRDNYASLRTILAKRGIKIL